MWLIFLCLIETVLKLPLFRKTSITSCVTTFKNYFWSTQSVRCLKRFSRKVKPPGEAVLMHLGLTHSSTPLIIAVRSALARSVMHFYLPAKRERMGYFRTIMPADPSGAYLWLKRGKSCVKLGVGGCKKKK